METELNWGADRFDYGFSGQIMNTATDRGGVSINTANWRLGELIIANTSDSTEDTVMRLIDDTPTAGSRYGYAFDLNAGNLEIFYVASNDGYGDTTGTPTMQLTSGGNLNLPGTVTAPSDYRLKQNIQQHSVQESLNSINDLTLHTFTWKESGAKDMGLIAHEAAEVFPNIVHGEKDGVQNQSVSYMSLIPHLIGAVQALTSKVSILEARLAQYEDQNEWPWR